MSGISIVNSYIVPSTFRWLESAISELDERPEIAQKNLGTALYLGTLVFTVLTIPTDMAIGFAEALFCLIRHQDFSGALVILKTKWVEGIVQQLAFISVGSFTFITEKGDWSTSYRVTKYVIQELSQRIYLGTPHIFNSIRKALPSDSVERPNIHMSREEIIHFETYNKKRSVFYFDLREFQSKHQQTNVSIYVVKNHLTTIQQASSPASVLTLDLNSLTQEAIKKRSKEMKESFGREFYQNTVVLDMLKVILSAESYLSAYLDLPLTVRQCIKKP